MAVEELQKLLGQIETDEQGEALLVTPKYTAAKNDEHFEAKRQVTAPCTSLFAQHTIALIVASPPAFLTSAGVGESVCAALPSCRRLALTASLQLHQLHSCGCAVRCVIGEPCIRGPGHGSICQFA